jgi:hypothetical protein
MTPSAAKTHDVRWALLFVGGLFLGGLFAGIRLAGEATPLAKADRISIFYYLFLTCEPLVLGISIAFLSGCYLWMRGKTSNGVIREPGSTRIKSIRTLAMLVFLITVVGTLTAYHGYPLAADEYMVTWQARIFLAGGVVASLPDEVLSYAESLRPVWANYNEVMHSWISKYLPIYALMHAPFAALGAGVLLNPILSAVGILLMAGVARRLWPENAGAPWLAAVLMASSSQFLITGMSFFSMPAHLCFNLVWLLLYLRDRPTDRLVLPWVGVLALGLHTPFVHALFVLPFLLRIVRDRPWRTTAYVGVVYLIGCAGWFAWTIMSRPVAANYQALSSGIDFNFAWPDVNQLRWQFFSLIELFDWQNLALGMLAVVAFRRWAAFSPVLRDLAWGIVLPFVFNCFVAFDQGVGWGYRYCHGVLGNMVLLALAGGWQIREQYGQEFLQRLIAAAILLAVAVLLPIRAWQVESFVRPFARATAYIKQRPEDIVLVDRESVWHGWDLIRNDPFLATRPWVMVKEMLTEEQVSSLRQQYSVHHISAEQLTEFGLIGREPPKREASSADKRGRPPRDRLQEGERDGI